MVGIANLDQRKNSGWVGWSFHEINLVFLDGEHAAENRSCGGCHGCFGHHGGDCGGHHDEGCHEVWIFQNFLNLNAMGNKGREMKKHYLSYLSVLPIRA